MCSTFVLLLPVSRPTVSSCILAKRNASEAPTGGVFMKAVLKDFAKFTGKYLHWCPFLCEAVNLGRP